MPCILVCHSISVLPYSIILDKNNYVKHPKWEWRSGVVFFSRENTPEGCTGTQKSYFFPYRQVSGRNGDNEWLRITNAFILCDLLWKVQKNHAANRKGSFKMSMRLGHEASFATGSHCLHCYHCCNALNPVTSVINGHLDIGCMADINIGVLVLLKFVCLYQ